MMMTTSVERNEGNGMANEVVVIIRREQRDGRGHMGGDGVTSPFEVMGVYVWPKGVWKLGSLSFTRLMER